MKELSKIYDPQKIENEIYSKWKDGGFFNPDSSSGEKKYSIVMPPPNVTGTLHMGHAAMLALEDIMTRFHRMQGHKTLWLPGTDHAAIATQTKVEKIIKEEGLTRQSLGREKFLDRVHEFAQNSHDTIKNQVIKMGSSCDWSREAYTLDETRNKAVRSVFKLMHDDGLIYRGDRVVNWCPRCKSTLADDEVEYKNQKAKLYTFKYDKDFPISIATTRPETKLGDTAVAVNPSDERYKQFIGQTFEADFCGIKLSIKIIADHNIDMNFGTGALGVTPAHSMIDWKMAKDHNLETIKVIDEDGNIHEGFGEFSGLTAADARKKIVSKLTASGINLIEKEEEIENNLSVCYRCSTAIEPLPSLQWFIDVNKKIEKYGKSLKEMSLGAVSSGIFGREKINIIPERFEKNYFAWMENLQDWCISRQIWFGHQIPVWYKNNSQLTTNNLQQEVFVGVEAPEGDGWVQDSDTLDTWFSSGLWTFSTLANNPEQIRIEDGKLIIDSEDFRNFHPTDVLETGYDIIFFWVARMILMTTYALGDIPFKNVYLHGLVRDENGKKMSKSLGNVIDPLDMIAKYGTDATRLSLVLGSTPGNDLKLSEEKIESYRNFTNKLWNIARYIISSQEDKIEKIAGKNLTVADKWILSSLITLGAEVTADIENYQFSQAGEKLKNFTWNEFADWYIEISKFEKNKKEKQWILHYVLENLLRLWHPFMPFVTEAIWSEMEKENMLIIEAWPSFRITESFIDNDKNINKEAFDLIREIIISIRNGRLENKIDPKKKIKVIIDVKEQEFTFNLPTAEILKNQEIIIKNLRTGIEQLNIISSGEKIENAIQRTVGGINIYIPLEGLVDMEKEKTRIQKEIETIEKFVTGLESRLSNEVFVSKAPKQVIDQQRESLAKKKTELEELKKQLISLTDKK